MRVFFLTILALLASAVATLADQGLPEMAIQNTGTCRDVSVRDIVLGDFVPMGCLDVTTHTFIIDQSTAFGGDQAEHTFFAGPSSGSGGPAFRVFSPSDFDTPGTNISLGSNSLATVTPDVPDAGDGVSNVAIGSGAMQYTESANSTVAIGVNACNNYGKRRVLLDNDDDFTGWTLGTGWSAAGGFATHAAGNTASLTRATTEITDNTPYFLNFTITGRTAGTITPKLSGGGTTVVGTDYSVNGTYSQLFRGNEGNAQAEFAPSSDFDGRISAVQFITLGGRTTVCLGHLAGQYIGNAPSSTFVGGYAGQGAQTDTVTGLDIGGTDDASPLSGTNNACMGEACMLHIRGGASTNDSVGFNTLFNMTTGSGNSALGNAAMSYGTTLVGNVAVGTGAYKYGNGTNNVFSGASAGLGTNAFTTLAGDTAVGDFTVQVADASIFQVNGGVDNGALFAPGTKVTAIDLGTNTITVDKAIWKATTASAAVSLIYSIPSIHTGQLNVGVGAFALQDIQGAANFNTSLGAQSCKDLTTGSTNICIGRNSGLTLTTGTNNIYIGGSSTPSSASVTFEMNLANTIKGTSVGAGTAGFIGIGAAWPSAAFDGTTYRLDVQGYLRASGIFVTESGRIRKVRVVTAAGGIAAAKTDDVIVVNKASGAATNVALPSSPATGQTIVIKDGKGDAGSNNITLTPNAGTIDGAGTKVINTNYGCAVVIYNATEWNTLTCSPLA